MAGPSVNDPSRIDDVRRELEDKISKAEERCGRNLNDRLTPLENRVNERVSHRTMKIVGACLLLAAALLEGYYRLLYYPFRRSTEECNVVK